MRIRTYNLLCIMILCCELSAQIQDHDVYLLSNLCDASDLSKITQSISHDIRERQISATVIINGDLTDTPIDFPQGAAQYQRAIDMIRSLSKVADVIVMTGDRDWNDNQSEGYRALKLLNQRIREGIQDIDRVRLLFAMGCPGPKSITINNYIKMIAINSQWWNHTYEKPQPPDALCEYITIPDIVEEIDDMIRESDNQNVLIVAHHPMRSLGNYGGRFSLSENIKPFPIIGSVLNAYRSNIGGSYDLSNPRLKRFTYHMYNSLYFHENIVYASGHEQNHQIHTEVDNILVNSGAPSQGNYAPRDHSTLLHENDAGYIRLEYEVNGRVSSSYVAMDTQRDTSLVLLRSVCDPTDSTIVAEYNDSYIPCYMDVRLPSQNIIEPYATVRPGEGYRAGWIKKLFLGAHHRKSWTTPVTVPYLRIDTESIDLNPYKDGGGRQTLALKFEDENGKRYTFRSVDKRPRKELDYELRKSIIGRIFKDQTSAQHPFGAIPVSRLLDHLNILHAIPKLYVLPDTDDLGPYRDTYGGMLGMLEENPGKKDRQGQYFAQADDVLRSNQLFEKLYRSNNNIVNQREYVRARLFDILVGDWGRHPNNWKWAEYSTGEGNIYRPIPKDRDRAFSNWDGILPWLADREWALPSTEGFDHDIDGMESLVYQARHLDRFVASEADWDVYASEAGFIQEQLTDEVIMQAMRSLPTESYEIAGPAIVEKLKQRRDDLLDHARRYYQLLSNEVDVVGSQEIEVFKVTSQGDDLLVEVYSVTKDQIDIEPYYSRRFVPAETKRVKIYGLGAQDIYDVSIDDIDMEVILIGGDGKDVYNIDAPALIIVDDQDVGMQNVSYRKIEDNWQRSRYVYDRTARKFDSYIPRLSLGYNGFNGFLVSGGARWTMHRWDKPDYHMRHDLRLRLSSRGDYGLSYDGIVRHAFDQYDLIYSTLLANPDFFDSYYGQGNQSFIDPDLDMQNFYISTFNQVSGRIGVRREFWEDSDVSLSTGHSYYVNKRIENTILENESELVGANDRLHILPIELNVNLELRDDENFPRRGVQMTFDTYHGHIWSDGGSSFTTIGASYAQYFSSHHERQLTFGFKIGGVKGIDDVPFYLQPVLGGNNQLRGYTSNRFIGKSSLYANTELRWNLFQDQESTIPYDIGVMLFYDIGKVSNSDVTEGIRSKWHEGYGFGAYFVPFDEAFAISIYMSFSDENTWYPRFTIGTALN